MEKISTKQYAPRYITSNSLNITANEITPGSNISALDRSCFIREFRGLLGEIENGIVHMGNLGKSSCNYQKDFLEIFGLFSALWDFSRTLRIQGLSGRFIR